jgi:hypothetical protein
MVIASTLLGLLFILVAVATASSFALLPKPQEQSRWSKHQATYRYPNWLGQGKMILASSILSLASTTQSSIEDLKSLLIQHPDAPNYSALLARIQTLESQLDKLGQLYSDVQEKKASLETAQQNYSSAVEAETKANATLQSASENKKAQQESLTLKQLIRQEASPLVTEAEAKYDLLLQIYTTSQEQLTQQVTVYELAVTQLSEAQSEADSSQVTYNTLLQSYNNSNTYIADPNWVAPTQQVEHTRQIPHTTTRVETQTIQNLLFNPNFSQGTEGWSGVSSGWQGSSPALVNGEVIFSYSTQTVSQGLYSGPFLNSVLTLSADWFNNETNRGFTDVYSMTVEARDINQNPVGTATYNSTGSHDWQNKSVTLTPTGPVSYITISFTGIDSGYWYGVYGPHFKNPVLQITHGQEITETTYTTETYYTTEPVLTQGTLNVNIGEGGQATFTAPEGATFTSSNLRYEAYANSSCGARVTPNVDGLSSVTIRALNSVWGDPCGGYSKHVVGTLTYRGQPVAPRIPDPAIYAQLQAANSQLTEAQSNLETRTQNLASAIVEKERREQELQIASTNLTSAEITLSVKQEALASAELDEQAQTSQYNQAELYYATSFSEHESAQDFTASMQQQLTSQTQQYETAQQEANTLSTQIDGDYQSLSTEVSSIQPTPEPEPEPLIDLAAVPVLGEALAALSDVGEALANIGSDMSPETRAKAQKIVVSAIVVTQIATQAAQIATQAAAASASAAASRSGSGSSSTGRRK